MRARGIPPFLRLLLLGAACALAVAHSVGGVAWVGVAGQGDGRQPGRGTGSAAAPVPAPGSAVTGTATVTRGTFVKTVRLNGLVEAVSFSGIRAPQLQGAGGQQLVITKLLPKGARVRKGDLVVEFDRQTQLRTAQDKRAEWQDLEEQIRKKRAEQLAQEAKDETELKAAVNAAALAELDVQKNEVLPRIEAEKNRLSLEAARAKLKQLQETFALKRKAALADVRILEVRRDRAALAMRQAEQNAERMAVKSPIDGLIVYRSIWRGSGPGDPQEGLELWPGAVLLDVVGIEQMRVRVKVNQADVDTLRIGQRASLRLDAYPDHAYVGRLDQIAPVAVQASFSPKVRTFTAIFTVDATDATLMPDLSAAVDVELERRENVLLAPRDALEVKDGKPHLRVKNGSGAESRPVTLAGMNDLQVVIADGVDAGTPVETLAERTGTRTAGGGS